MTIFNDAVNTIKEISSDGTLLIGLQEVQAAIEVSSVDVVQPRINAAYKIVIGNMSKLF
jgi:hypothetical protein